ncbi:major capsid protein [Limisalsivibrio acetivorans]|uniref:major capsid protein n=1 Tax=Limisalsivibrio acetivorans TaxID=1304888 RepID=UPI00138B11C9|nr:major capsid protein [Limisalsivibrio acetivorans]
MSIRALSEVISARTRKSTFLARKYFGYATPRIKRVTAIRIDVKKGSERLAPLVNPLSGNPVFQRDGYKSINIDIPLIGGAVETSIEEMFRSMEGQPEVVKDDIRDIYNTFLDETSLIDDAITRTEEYMAAQLLKTGKCVVEGVGPEGTRIQFEFDFQRDVNHRLILTSGSQWGESDVSPFDDIKTARIACSETGGLLPNVVTMGDTAVEHFLADPKVANRLDNRGMDYGKLAPQELDNDVTYIGYVREIGHIYTYVASYTDTDGSTQRYIPSNGVVLGNDKAENRTYYGGVAVNQNDKPVIKSGRRIVTPYISKRQPVTQSVDVNSRPMLTLSEPDTTFYMEV